MLNLLKEALQVRSLIVKELNLFLALLRFNLATRSVARLDGLNLRLQFDYFVRLFFLFGFEFHNALLEVGLAVLSLQLLAHGEGYGTLIKGLICCNGHHNLVSDSEK